MQYLVSFQDRPQANPEAFCKGAGSNDREEEPLSNIQSSSIWFSIRAYSGIMAVLAI